MILESTVVKPVRAPDLGIAATLFVLAVVLEVVRLTPLEGAGRRSRRPGPRSDPSWPGAAPGQLRPCGPHHRFGHRFGHSVHAQRSGTAFGRKHTTAPPSQDRGK
ncbi:hypothetical protein [Enhygromyxa salina]|uniref:hypothetical protein n=1 Tax=Enhygromyxa salina TaxID=215803 RepID=UPI0011BA7C20|nr:hypothetical protein [Enhygromyxa salina]